MDEKPKILVVDDTPQMVAALERTFGDGYVMVSATTGAQALTAALRDRPDLILLDIHLPDMDGLTVCRRLKSDARTEPIPVIFITGSDIGIDQTFEAGGADYVSKPFMAAEVVARVSTHISLLRSMENLQKMNARLDRRVAVRTKELEETNLELNNQIERRRIVEKRLATLSTIDPLTHLPTRAVFYDAVKRALEDKKHTALVKVKIDQLRETNQTFGFSAGDAELCRVAAILEGMIEPEELIGRVGGCRFSLLLKGENYSKRAEKIVELIATADKASDTFAIEVNVGIVPTLDMLALHQIVMLADEACVQAREAGGDMMVEFTEDAVQTMLATHSLQSTAIIQSKFEADRFILLKQTILATQDDSSFGTEVFIQPPEVNRRVIDRYEFFRHISRLRLRAQIDHWVLNRAAALTLKGRCVISVTSPRVDNDRFWELVETVIDKRKKAGGTLAFQVDEKAFTTSSHARKFARRVNEVGGEIVIDEFTGQRLDFSELRKIPAVAVKLDSKFLRSIDTHPESQAMLGAVCELAHAAGFDTIAKEVDQYRWVAPLREVGIDFLQGDAIGKSASASHFG